MPNKIGIDIVDVDNFQQRITKNPQLKNRLFTPQELEYCKDRPVYHLAARFAAKEAFAKAANSNSLPWQDVEVRKNPSGRPFLHISETIKQKANIKECDLSLSHTEKVAVAAVIITPQ